MPHTTDADVFILHVILSCLICYFPVLFNLFIVLEIASASRLGRVHHKSFKEEPLRIASA